ncbi:2-amino-4-hydroxy-6-hydroxymethyldihydropteridine diphosphokinase [Aquiflexum sp.]|uniref:2-amino-4-hydroxy-6- hydroxymethyldihydropteridine diphosphokinase n=1 Tax=Aquiflexum sp. TaxID=1872584 RepID=UPI0035939A73
MDKVVLIIGGNLGDRRALIGEANKLLMLQFGIPKLSSSIYETTAWGGKSVGNYLNQILIFETTQSPENLLTTIQAIEDKMGRNRDLKWGDRTMDIDILYFGNKIIRTSSLIIPHPYIEERRFVLEPLKEVIPEFLHPLLAKSQQELLELCSDPCKVVVFEKRNPE